MSNDVETISLRTDDLNLYGRLRQTAPGGPTVVLLSGLGFHTFEYEPLAVELAAAGVNAFSFDFRGHGRSGGRRGRWTLDELAVDCRHAIGFVHRRGTGPIMLFGNSLGAMIAILAGSRDERVIGVAAANTPAQAAGWALSPARRMLLGMLEGISLAVPIRISVNPFLPYKRLIDDPAWISAIRRDPLIADARRLSMATIRELLQTWDGPVAVHDLHRPLLVIQGSQDRLQPPRESELVYAAANDPKRYELVDTGHLPHLEAPAMLAGLLTGWLAATLPAPQ